MGAIWTTFPAPENVALAGAPNNAGCGDAAGLHPSPVLQGGDATGGTTRHGDRASHTCASYTSATRYRNLRLRVCRA